MLMWVVKTKSQTLKERFPSLLSQAELDSSLSPRLLSSLLAAGYARPSPLREKASGAKRDVEELFLSAILFFFSSVCSPKAAGNICFHMDHLLIRGFALLFLTLLLSHPTFSTWYFLPFLEYVFPEVSPAVHRHRAAPGLF